MASITDAIKKAAATASGSEAAAPKVSVANTASLTANSSSGWLLA